MSARISVGLSKKIGLPAYSSAGATCQIEFEADSSLLRDDPLAFFQRVRGTYAACMQAVDEQLARWREGLSQNTEPAPPPETSVPETELKNPVAPARRGHRGHRGAVGPNGHGAESGNGHGARSEAATAKQLAYARQLAAEIPGLGLRRLGTLAAQLLGKTSAELSRAEAGVLIETLKNIQAGSADLAELLPGPPA
jgi:hypothetical protein